MWDSIGSWGANNSGAAKAAYLIPESGNVVMHVNAPDLNNGTAKVGPVWSKTGTVAYNSAGTPRPSVGPFNVGGYFSLSPGNVLNFGASSFTFAIIGTVTSYAVSNSPIFLNNGAYNSSGFYVQSYSTVVNLNESGSGTFTQASFALSVPLSTTLIIICGVDAVGGQAYMTVNGAAPATAASVTMASTALRAILGSDGTNAINSLQGTIIEAYASTDRPSSTLFTSMYNSIVAAE